MTGLKDYIAVRMQRPVVDSAQILAARVAERLGPCVQAVLFYGSCLRRDPASPDRDEGLYDFYVLVDRYRHCYGRRWWLSLANHLLPPNVFYIETPGPRGIIRAKYAVLTLDDFEKGTSPRSFQSSLWARFAQPSQIIHAKDADVHGRVLQSLTRAIETYLGETRPLLAKSATPREIWLNAFRQSYRAELRPEDAARAITLYEADQEYYDRLIALVLPAKMPPRHGLTARAAEIRWWGRRVTGKILNILRLIKASFTFDGGADYLLWKVARHSGVTISISNWQRRHPVLAAPLIALKLYRKGAFR